MTPTTLAETILKDVPKELLAKIIYEAMRYERRDTTPDWVPNGNAFAQDEARRAAAKVQDAVLAALTAAMDPAIAERAGEVLSRLRKADEYEPLGHDGWEAADLLTALLAQLAAMEAQIKGLEGGIEAACDNADSWSVSRGAARVDLTIVDAAITEERK